MDPNAPPPPPSGLVLVDKPADKRISSMTVVRSVKRRLVAGGVGDPRRKRNIAVGHAGTLDPLAGGLLIVLVGRATRLCDRLMLGEKEYLATIDLAHSSNTDDLEGELTTNPALTPLTREDVERVIREKFMGVIMQAPPAFSAIWIDARRAYDLARAGKAPEMTPRPVTIHEIAVEAFMPPTLVVRVRCGKGTYIRSLARDMGVALTGHAACLTALRRTAIGPYRVEQATELNNLPERMTAADLLNPADSAGG